MLKALIDEGPSGLTQRIISQAGVDSKIVSNKLEEHFKKQPRVSGASQDSMSMSKLLLDCFSKSNNIKKEFGDQYISVEHLLLGAAETEGFTKRLFAELSSLGKLKEAVKTIRGNNQVTSRNPEQSYEALKKYSRDLTEAAAEGKLDPVIGRDEEIRRTVQILSRRTKNNPILLGEPGVGKVQRS